MANNESVSVGAIDIGGTKIAIGVVDDDGRILAHTQFPTEASSGFESAMRRSSAALKECVQRAGGRLRGIGIGCAGQIDWETGTLSGVNNLPGWEGGNPVEYLTREFQVPVALENDGDAVALGEMRRGGMKDKRRLIFVTVGTGIGAGVILDGRIYRGVTNAHPEIGHHVVDPAGPDCSCGAKGCWEACASGPAMAAWFKANAPAGQAGKNLSAREICALAEQGDEWGRRAAEHEAFYLGLGMGNLVTIFAPEVIVLGGSVMKSSQLFLGQIHRMIGENCTQVPAGRVQIALASVADVNLIGAAEVWHHRFGEAENAGA